MPKVRLLASTSYKDEPHAAGATLDVDDEQAAAWRSSGMASLIEDEEAAAKRDAERPEPEAMTREKAGGSPPAPPPEETPRKK